MRDRKTIEQDIRSLRSGYVYKVTEDTLKMEVLLDIRELLMEKTKHE